MNITELQEKFNSDKIRVFEGKGGLTFIGVKTPLAEALLTTQGGQIMEFTPAGEKPVLWTSDSSWYASDKPLRGGMPVCWPWFGPHPDASKPAHGFARSTPWEVKSIEEAADGTMKVTFFLDETLVSCGCGKPFLLEITYTIGKSLTADLTTSNTADVPVEIATALHTYFCVSDIEKVTVSGLEGAVYDNRVVGKEENGLTQQGDVTFGIEVDRIYYDSNAVVINDPGMNRRIRVGKANSRTTIVWNPWIEKAKKMPDFGNEDYHGMLCVEAANALTDKVTIPAGGKHTLSQYIELI
ncbi:MAG: D-hexose-6-phosphate mutarotase [Lentisphaeria bacterium]|nr:D-hexose-6-phosphate mutarotase [Lentisphaeria bacterium]